MDIIRNNLSGYNVNKQRYTAHHAHSARGAITRSSGELDVTDSTAFLMKGLYVWYKNVSRKKYVGLASLMVGPTILQANKSDGPAVIVLIFEPCSHVLSVVVFDGFVAPVATADSILNSIATT